MNKSKLTALCGVMTALSVVLMSVTTIIPVFMYVVPIVTGIIVLIVADVSNKKWGIGVYFATSVLSLLLVTDKEAVLTYVLFFGFYPLIREYVQKLPKLLSRIVKLILFNCSAVLIGVAGVLVFGVSAEEYKELGKATIPLLLGLANIVFLLYDAILTRYEILFKGIQVKLKKLMK